MKSSSPTQGRILELDGIRGLAILLIVLDHYVYAGTVYNQENAAAGLIRNLFPLSWSGVDLFFVLSGFLIGGILMDQRDSESYFKTFYLRRACRILPLYFLWVILFFIAARIFSTDAGKEWYPANFTSLSHFPQWGYFCFLQNFEMARGNDFGSIWLGITWSLCIEEQFYLVMPLVIWLIPRRILPHLVVFLIALGVAFRLYMYTCHSAIFTYVLLPCRADGLLLGVLCAWLVRHPKPREAGQKRDWLYLAVAVLFIGMVFLTVFARKLDQQLFGDLNSFEMIFGYLWIDCFYACLLYMVIAVPAGWFAWMMRAPWFRHFGVVSYSVYLTHGVVAGLLYALILGRKSTAINDLSSGMVTLLAFLATWLLAVLSWRFLKSPLLTGAILLLMAVLKGKQNEKKLRFRPARCKFLPSKA